MAGPRDWSPRPKGSRERGGFLIKVIQNLGDASPFEYGLGGYIIYRVRDPDATGPDASWINAEYWPGSNEEREDAFDFDVYRWTIEPDVIKDLSWVKDWGDVATTMGTSVGEIMRMGRSGNPIDRAQVYRMVGDYYGYDNLNDNPEPTTLKEMEKRWPEFA